MSESDRNDRAPEGDASGRIKVTDRRSFTREGERRDDATAGNEAAAPASEPAAAGAPASTPPPEPPEVPASIDFVTFIHSLYVSALMSLGEVENPYTKQLETNLVIARQNIDILTMLRDKTRGNLDAEEQGLIDQVVPHLQLLYVKKAG